ncbi:unnamed protein product [Sphagnum jensenii]|uniref:YHYH domain-containing protein n=1 Tax=Sphagnum jensenii TaxID=128206 RepID=A0ABP0VLB6_9BRYO
MDAFPKMIDKAKAEKFNYPYLCDGDQKVGKSFSAQKTPHAFVIWKENGKWVVKYSGAIDDNGEEPQNVKEHYVANAVDALLKGKPVLTKETKSIGCQIHYRNAHTIDYGKVILRHWNISAGKKYADGSFLMFKNGDVYIEDARNKITHYPLASLSADDQEYVHQRYAHIQALNTQTASSASPVAPQSSVFDLRLAIAAFLIIGLGMFMYSSLGRSQLKYLMPVMIAGVITVAFGFSARIHKSLQVFNTSPLFIDSAFTPYKPSVITSWDSVYFYVGSYGIPSPTQQMMAGITSWNQQVPLPQCYTGSNVWSIPLHPVLADTVIAVTPYTFTRGAIALATNGIPIFNVYTNTGTDSYLSGQLDSFGGHSGRADDYHYHIAPLFLQNQGSVILPVAFAFDGFAVYGTLEPNGAAMLPLDTNHGHYGANGLYHYHGTATAPYMIKNFVGKVTMDTTLQLVPQAASHPVRQGQNPLPGAVITGCHPNCVNGYTLIYTLNGQTDSIVYSWTTAGTYTYGFYSNGVDTATQTYHGFTPCYTLPLCSPTSITTVVSGTGFTIYPNPSTDDFYLRFDDASKLSEVKSIMVYNLSGELVYQTNAYTGKINMGSASPGVYIVKVSMSSGQLNQKLVVSR